MITKEEIQQKITTDPRWALRALTRLYERQTRDEQLSAQTSHLNGQGFTGPDAELLTSFYQQYKQRGWLSAKQTEYLFKRMKKYAGQIYRIAQQREEEAA